MDPKCRLESAAVLFCFALKSMQVVDSNAAVVVVPGLLLTAQDLATERRDSDPQQIVCESSTRARLTIPALLFLAD